MSGPPRLRTALEGDHEAVSATFALARELVAKCPDEATESVLADWCEENERRKFVQWLRSESPAVRACAVTHLASLLDGVVTADAFHAALRLAHALGERDWYEIAEALSRNDPDVEPRGFVEKLRANEGPLATRRCPACGHPAFLVTEHKTRHSADDDYDEWWDEWALCVHGLHRERTEP